MHLNVWRCMKKSALGRSFQERNICRRTFCNRNTYFVTEIPFCIWMFEDAWKNPHLLETDERTRTRDNPFSCSYCDNKCNLATEMVSCKYFSLGSFYLVRIFSCIFKHSDAKWYFGYKLRISVAKFSPANISLLKVSTKCGFFHAPSNIQMVYKMVFRLQNTYFGC